MLDCIESILVSEEEISAITDRIAAEIRRDYSAPDKRPVLLCVLKGSTMFTAELMKKVQIPMELEFIKVSSYGAGTVSSGNINIQYDMNRSDIAELDIIVVEDIIDSGRTLSKLVRHLNERGAKSIRCCTLLDKPDRREVDFVPDYCGTVIPDKFVVGFGLDYNEKYRNLPFVGVLDPKVYS